MSTHKLHRKFVSNLLGTSGTKNIQPCINGKTLSLDFVRKRKPKAERRDQMRRVIPSRKYTGAGEGYVQCAVADNPLAQHVHQLALEAMNAPPAAEDIDSTPAPPRPHRTRGRVVALEQQRGTRDRRNNVPRAIKVKAEPKVHAATETARPKLGNIETARSKLGNTETARPKLGPKTQYITRVQSAIADQTLLAEHTRQRVTARTAPRVKHESTAVAVSHVTPETPVTPCTRSRVMFAGSTPGCELTRDSTRGDSRARDRSALDDDTCHSSEPQSDRCLSELDSSPMVLTSGWARHSATSTPHEHGGEPARDQSECAQSSPPFAWPVIASLARDSSPSPLLSQAPLDEAGTPKQRAIQRLFQQNSYLKRRVRDLTQHLLRAHHGNKASYL